MRPEVTYTAHATSSKEQTGYLITFTQFEEEKISTKLAAMQKTVTNPITNQL